MSVNHDESEGKKVNTSDHEAKPDNNRRENTTPESYAVGYGKPPEETRFAKGKSGNPRGRPRKPKPAPPRLYEGHTESHLEQEAYRTVPLRENGEEIEIPATQAVLRSLGVQGIKGNRLAAQEFLNRVNEAEQEQLKRRIEQYLHYEALKRAGEREMERCRELGMSPPELLPHPDDIVLNPGIGEAWVNGPETKEDLKSYEFNAELRDYCILVASRFRKRSACNEKRKAEAEPKYDLWLIWAQLLDHLLPSRFRWQDAEDVTLLMRCQSMTKREREKRINSEWKRLVANKPVSSRITPELQGQIERTTDKLVAQFG